METLIGLTFAMSPLVLVVALLLAVDGRHRRRESEVARQIALTDALHARLGALVAPVVRRRHGVWRVSVAVPVDQPRIIGALLAIVDEVFGRAAYELRLSRQVPVAPRTATLRPARTERALSWT
jgi:hypothetical protein